MSKRYTIHKAFTKPSYILVEQNKAPEEEEPEEEKKVEVSITITSWMILFFIPDCS